MVIFIKDHSTPLPSNWKYPPVKSLDETEIEKQILIDDPSKVG